MIYVVISHNQDIDIGPCLRSLRKQSFRDFSVALVLGEDIPRPEASLMDISGIEVLRHEGVRWWAESMNMGIQYAWRNSARFILLLDSDVVLPVDFLENMVYWGRRKPLAILGALETDPQTGKIIYSGERESGPLGKAQSLISCIPRDEWSGIKQVSVYAGKAMWVPSVVFEQVGMFDSENFPHYMAALDFTRESQKSGFELYANMDARLTTPQPRVEVYRRRKSVRNFFRHLFDIKGKGNLKYYTKYIVKNYAQVWWPFHLLGGYTRRLIGYWIK